MKPARSAAEPPDTMSYAGDREYFSLVYKRSFFKKFIVSKGESVSPDRLCGKFFLLKEDATRFFKRIAGERPTFQEKKISKERSGECTRGKGVCNASGLGVESYFKLIPAPFRADCAGARSVSAESSEFFSWRNILTQSVFTLRLLENCNKTWFTLLKIRLELKTWSLPPC